LQIGVHQNDSVSTSGVKASGGGELMTEISGQRENFKAAVGLRDVAQLNDGRIGTAIVHHHHLRLARKLA
jgi:hypothetical protein